MTARAREMKASGIDVLSFAVGEPDFNTPEPIIEAAKKALDQGLTKYAPSRGLPLLIEAIQRKTERENGFTCQANQVVVSCGAKHCLYNAFQVLLNPGDEAILFAPFWMTYADQVALADGIPVIVPTSAENGFQPDPAAIESAITPRTKIIVCNSPSNPTGGAWDRATVEAVATIAERHNLTIVSDEIYEHLTYDGHQHTGFAQLGPETASRTVTILGVSKTYSMTGWRIGFAISPPEIATAMANIQDQVTSNATTFAQAGAAAALDSDPALVQKMAATFAERRTFGMEQLRKIDGLGVPSPKGAFYFFLDVSRFLGGEIADDCALAEHLLDKAHIATVPGSVFHAPGHIRFSYAAGLDTIAEGARRLGDALKGLQ